MTQDIEGNYRTFCGFLNINLFGHFCFRLMSMIFFFYLTFCLILFRNVLNYLDSKMPVNLVQYRGTVGVFNNRKFTKKLQYKEISKLKFINTCFISNHSSLHSHSMVSFFILLIVFFLSAQSVERG